MAFGDLSHFFAVCSKVEPSPTPAGVNIVRTLMLDVFSMIAAAAIAGCADSEPTQTDSLSGVGGSAPADTTHSQAGGGKSGSSTSSGTKSLQSNAGGASSSASTPSTTTSPVASVGGSASSANPSVGKGGAGVGGATSSVGGNGSGGKVAAGGADVGVGGKTATPGAAGKAAGGKASSVGGASGAGGRAAATGGRAAGGAATGGTSESSPVATAGAPDFGDKFVGNITTGNSIDSGGLTYSKYWNQITPENAGKWGSVQSSGSSNYNWTTLDSIYSYATKNNVIFKQHCFLWGSQQPGGSLTETNVKNWMTEFCKRYPQTKVIDVVNEPPPHTTPSYANSIGGGTNGDWKWIANAFTWARAACPNAILVLNDYNNIEWSSDNSHFISIVKAIQSANAPIDAIGAQSHDLDHSGISSSTVKPLLEKLHTETGLPIYITEMDIDSSDDATQLKMYQDYFPLFLETEYVKGITIWGWIYGQTWSQASNSGLVRSGKSRSAMTYIMGLLNRPAP
jgi:endo-1,4-beta-xylanase